METTTAAALANAARQRDVAITLKHGDRVQFGFDGAPVTGALVGIARVERKHVAPASQWTIDGKAERRYVERETVDFTIDVRLSDSEARRYPLSRVTGLTAAPLTGELPPCAAFTGTGQRCAVCRVHKRLHG